MSIDSQFFKATDLKLFPQSSILVLHHQQTNKTYLHKASRDSYQHYGNEFHLVSCVLISEFNPYFMLYDEEIQVGLVAEIIGVIGRAGQLGKKLKRAADNPFPNAFKRLAKKLIRCYQHWMNADFVTEVFISKLYRMLKKIWDDSRAYYCSVKRSAGLHAKLQCHRPIESFVYEC